MVTDLKLNELAGAVTKLRVHPAADLFPMMSEAEYQKLKSDIQANGQVEDITTYQGQMLDGRNRYRILCELGVEPKTREYTGSDPLGYVLSKNLHRRHLSASQRAMIAAELATLKRGGDRSKVQNCTPTRAQAAKQLKVSPRLVNQAAAIRKVQADSPAGADLVEQVNRGEISVNKAHQIVESAKSKQTAVIVEDQNHTTLLADEVRPSASFSKRLEVIAAKEAEFHSKLEDLATAAENESGLYACRKALVAHHRSVAEWHLEQAERVEEMSQLSRLGLLPIENA